MPSTARSLGVDPHSTYENILGGAKYIKDKLDKYDGDVRLALAAYSAGPGRVDKAIREAGTTDWDSVVAYLPGETRNFVPRVIGTYS